MYNVSLLKVLGTMTFGSYCAYVITKLYHACNPDGGQRGKYCFALREKKRERKVWHGKVAFPLDLKADMQPREAQ